MLNKELRHFQTSSELSVLTYKYYDDDSDGDDDDDNDGDDEPCLMTGRRGLSRRALWRGSVGVNVGF